jgi:hypothetical protein
MNLSELVNGIGPLSAKEAAHLNKIADGIVEKLALPVKPVKTKTKKGVKVATIADPRERLLKIKDVEFARHVEQEYRPNIARTLRDIENGSVGEDDLVGLWNWSMAMLVAMTEMSSSQYKGCRQRSWQLSDACGNRLVDDLPVQYPGQQVSPGTTESTNEAGA